MGWSGVTLIMTYISNGGAILESFAAFRSVNSLIVCNFISKLGLALGDISWVISNIPPPEKLH